MPTNTSAPPPPPPTPDIDPVEPPPSEDQAAAPSKSRSRRQPDPTATATRVPVVRHTLNELPPAIRVSNWPVGAQGRRLDAVGVGQQAIIDQGLLDALDLWGYITPGVEVCFMQWGRMVLLDAAFSPRKPVDLAAYQRDGMTCAQIDRAGTVVLLQSDQPPPAPAMATPMQACLVYPTAVLNFRDGPRTGAILGLVRPGQWLSAVAKRDGYFQVYQLGRYGWVSADYVQTSGACG